MQRPSGQGEGGMPQALLHVGCVELAPGTGVRPFWLTAGECVNRRVGRPAQDTGLHVAREWNEWVVKGQQGGDALQRPQWREF